MPIDFERILAENIRRYGEETSHLKLLLEELYPETTTHFVEELIQNADDAEASEFKLLLDEDKWIVMNDGKIFSEQDVKDICSIAQTSKEIDKIGTFGIGFKSVYSITSRPEIYSGGHHFCIEHYVRPYRLEGFPDGISADDEVDLARTVFLLRFDPSKVQRDEKRKISAQFASNFRALLFLRHLRGIMLVDRVGGQKLVFRKEETAIQGSARDGSRAVLARLMAEPEAREERWLRFDVEFPIPERFLEQLHKKNPGNKPTIVQIAFLLDDAGAIVPLSEERYLYAFLPTQMVTNLRFLVQGRYQLITARTQLKKVEWNEWLIGRSGEAARCVLRYLRDMGRLAGPVYDMLPHLADFTEVAACLRPIGEAIEDEFRREPLVRSDGGKYVLPNRAFLAGEDLAAFLGLEGLQGLYGEGATYVEAGAGERGKRFLTTVGVKEIGITELIASLGSSAAQQWLAQQNLSFFVRLFAFFYDKRKILKKSHVDALKNVPLVPLQHGGLARCADGSLYFPVTAGEDGIIRVGGLRFVHETLLRVGGEEEQELTRAKQDARKFLRETLDIREANPYEIIEHYILPIYESDQWRTLTRKERVAHVRYICRNLEAYKQGVDAASRQYEGQRIDHLGRLRQTLWLETVNRAAGGKWYHMRAADLYLSRRYELKVPLGGLFKVVGVQFPGISPVYLGRVGTEARRNARRARRWRVFFQALGVEDKLRVLPNDKIGASYLTREDCGQLRHWGEWSEQALEDWVPCEAMARILDAAHANPRGSRLARTLLTMLDENWGAYAGKCTLTYKWKARVHWYQNKAPSTFLERLRTAAWIPTTKGTFVRPRDAFVDRPEVRRLLGQSVPYVAYEFKNPDFLKALGVRTEASVESILEHLREQIRAGCEDFGYFSSVYYFFYEQCVRKRRGAKQPGSEELLEGLRSAFGNERLIFVMGRPERYFTAGEVVWPDVSDVLGDVVPCVEPCYRDLRQFFVALGVELNPGPQVYGQALERLAERGEAASDDKRRIAKIYEQLEEYLEEENRREFIREEWWQALIEKPVFLATSGAFARRHELYLNDDPDIAALFTGRLDFLWLPQAIHLERLGDLLEELRIPRISSIRRQPRVLGWTRPAEAVETRLERFKPHIVGYLWSRHHRYYSKWKADGMFGALRSLRVWEADALEIVYQVNGETRCEPRAITIHDGQLYVRSDSVNDTDLVALELAVLFGRPPGLAEFITTLFDKDSEAKIDRFLNLHRVELPEEEAVWFGALPRGRAPSLGERTGAEKTEGKKDREEAAVGVERGTREGVGRSTEEEELSRPRVSLDTSLGGMMVLQGGGYGEAQEG